MSQLKGVSLLKTMDHSLFVSPLLVAACAHPLHGSIPVLQLHQTCLSILINLVQWGVWIQFHQKYHLHPLPQHIRNASVIMDTHQITWFMKSTDPILLPHRCLQAETTSKWKQQWNLSLVSDIRRKQSVNIFWNKISSTVAWCANYTDLNYFSFSLVSRVLKPDSWGYF